MFLKVQSLGMMSAADIAMLAPAVTRLAELEGFPMHGRGASIRLPEV
jgi:histidinol dehydrogenase